MFLPKKRVSPIDKTITITTPPTIHPISSASVDIFCGGSLSVLCVLAVVLSSVTLTVCVFSEALFSVV